ncbi:MAG: ExbD/TolR family protein [Candidatus Methylomirabilales bacterium]
MEFEGRSRRKLALNLVPLVNVIFLLLIFFVLAGTIRAPDPFNLVPPESEMADRGEIEPLFEPLEIALGVEGQVAINGKEIPRDTLPQALAEHFSNDTIPAVTFKVDARTDTGDMIDVIRELRTVGAQLLLLQTRPTGTNDSTSLR